MAHRPIDVYLNDHLAGATFGADLARQLEARTEGTASQPEMSRLAGEIEADLDTLTDLMERLGATRNPGKQVAAWVAEKASRLKLTGVSSGNDEIGMLLSIEALSLGVEGKPRSGRRCENSAATIPSLLQPISMTYSNEPSANGRSWRPSGSRPRNARSPRMPKPEWTPRRAGPRRDHRQRYPRHRERDANH